uniref:outer kinetochore KNL1 complex subunit KNL1 n=1 Tax=Pristiophorus japonicus TaxID=55135 RepID=UPI00398EAD8C
MDENSCAFSEANAEIREGKCKRTHSGILKVSRSPLRTLKEVDICQKMEPVGKVRRSSRRVSFAETKEVKEFVTDAMMIMQADVENGEDNQKENQQEELERDMMPLNANFSIAGMDALLHAPLRTPLQQFEFCEYIENVGIHQIFPISGLQVRSEGLEETVMPSETKVTSGFQKKIDSKSFLAGLDSTEPAYTNLCLATGEKGVDRSFSSIRQNQVPKQQKTIDFKLYLNSKKQSEADENKMVSMSSIFEEQVFKHTDFVTSACRAGKNIEKTNNSVLQSNSISNLDPNRTVMFLDQDNDMELTRSHTIAINHFALGNTTTLRSFTEPNHIERIDTGGSIHSLILQDKTVVFSEEDCMDMTRSHTLPIDVRKIDHITNQTQLTGVTNHKNDRRRLPSFTSDEHQISSDDGYCNKVNQNEVLGATKLTSRSVSLLSCFPSDKDIVISDTNDMDVTKSQTVAIDNGSLGLVANHTLSSKKMTSRRSNAESILDFPSDKTMVFSEANDMDITKSHTVPIESGNLGSVAKDSNKIISRQSIAGSILSSFPSDKTMVFSEANDMDITKCHTVAIDSGSLGQVTSEALNSTRMTTRLSVPGATQAFFPSDTVFSEANDRDITKSHTVPIESGSLGSVAKDSNKIISRQSIAGSILSSFPSDKTMVFSEANDMDITKSQTVAIESGNLGSVANEALNSTRMTSRLTAAGCTLSSFPSDKTLVFSEANDMDITNSHTVAIDSGSLGPVTNEALNSTRMTSRLIAAGCTVSSFPSDKTLVFSEANNMDITKSHTVPIESGNLRLVAKDSNKITSRQSIAGSILSFPNDKTMVFSEANDMDITKSQTVAIESGNLGSVANEALNSIRMTSRLTAAGCTLSSFPSDKTLVFSEANDMDITNSHTVAIDSGSLGPVTNEALNSTRMTSRLIAAGCTASSFPSDKTLVFSEANNMDITKSHTVPIESGNLRLVAKDSNKITSRQSIAGSILSFPNDKTMVFSEANDMDITKSQTVAIESGNLGSVANEALNSTRMTSRLTAAGCTLSSFPSDKTLVFSEANDMDITNSHTVAIDSGSLGPVTNEALNSTRMTSRLITAGCTVSSFPSDKTLVFSEANNMDITKSHTVPIESGNLRLVAKDSNKITSRQSIAGSVLSFPNDKTMVFSEANDMDITKSQTVAIESGNLGSVANETLNSTRMTSRLTAAGCTLSSFPSDKTLVFSEANDMDITKSHTVATDSGSLGQVTNEALNSTRPTSRLSVHGSIQASFPSDNNVVFSEANDMDVTKSHTIPIESGHLWPVATGSNKMTSRQSIAGSILSFPSDKTLVFSEANDMDITNSHTVAIDSGSLGPVVNWKVRPSTSFPGDKTTVFSAANDMDITKSNTVVIDSGSLGQVTNEALNSTRMTSRLTAAGCTLSSFPGDKTMLFSDANDLDITKSLAVAIVSGSLWPVANHTMDSNITTSKQNAAGSILSSLASDKTTVFSEANNMDITKSYKVAIESDSLGFTTNETLGSAKVTSKLNAPGSVLSSFLNDKSLVSEQVTPVIHIDTVPIRSQHDLSSSQKITHLVLEKGTKCFSNHLGNLEFSSIQTTVENPICNVDRGVDALGTSAPFAGSMEITIPQTVGFEGDAEQKGEPDSSSCVTGTREKMNGKGMKQSVLHTENSLDSILTCKNDKVQELILINQSREVASEEFGRYQSSDAQPECTANAARTESVSTANKNLGCNQSRKSMSSLQKLNSMTNVTHGTELERPSLGDKDPADCPWFAKQHSLIKDTFKSNISLCIFPPKLPSRENLYKAVHSNHHDVIKTSVEHLRSGSLLSTMYKSNKLEKDSKVFESDADPQKEPVIESQITDCDQVESKMFDQVELSHCLKSSEVDTLAIREQPGKEASLASEQGNNVTGHRDQVPGGSKMIIAEQRLHQKRAWSEVEENANACSKSKLRNLGHGVTDSSRQRVSSAPVVQWEGIGHGIVEENQLCMTTKSLDSNSSLDSTKGDGTSAHAVTLQGNLNTSLVLLKESELHQKLMDGQITVREFFKLLKVQTRAQKSRQSELQVDYELDKSTELENWLAVKFVHRPKREVYEEDSIALSAAIAELEDQLLDLDKLLSEVNFPLWKEVSQMTEEELQQFRSCLNAKKTTFVKRTKVICHEQKVQLYSAQLNMLKAQRQQRNETEDFLDDVLHKMDDCLASLDLANLDHLGECSVDVIHSDASLMQLEQTVADKHKDLKKLQVEHCDLESQLTKVLAEKALQEKAANLWDVKEEFQELLEWTLFIYQNDQAVYRFLHESLELTLKFEEPVCAGLSPSEKCRRILDIKLVSQLDEGEAPSHAKLVHELIMMYWKSRGSWHSVYPNESQLPMLLLDVSLVVSRCRLLGDELEYLLNWGCKFDILKTEIQHTDVKYLFSSYDALSKFELAFHLKPGYPWCPLQFTFDSWFGNISGEHINEVLLTVKPGHKYLTRIVKSLFLTLLIIPGANRFRLRHASP